MKINKEKITAMMSLPDDRLWEEIRRIAGGYGVSLPDKTPSQSEMNELRSAVSGSKINVSDALRLLNTYRRGTGK